ncbi:urea permease [Scheffersomyces coipomensis]|uniref:urea permease n=1 Tax=Scheffersomyces coipomensis TaxID=1788519 RepID=UPI00315DA7BE
MEPSLPAAAGYAVIIGGGAFFAIVMNYVTYLQNKYSKYDARKVDEFVSGSRSISFGLMLSGILSNWTWSLTILESAVKSYTIGISGSYWYAIGGLLQVSVFSIISSKIKKNANLVTTFPEMAYFRFGRAGHLSFLFCGFTCNSIVSACILLGGSSVFSAITGISQYAALFLIPFGVAIYVSGGGLRATFISDATHTTIILIFLIVFAFEVYVSNEKLGSVDKMWELLQTVPAPVAGNYQGSYLTFNSSQGGIFAIISIITGFGLVVNDQAYLSRAVAADPRYTSRAYFFASICWFVIPLSMGLTLGLAAQALSGNPDFPTLSEFEIGEGLPAVAAVVYLLGKTGSAMMLVTIFFSVTSSFAGELIATSTLISYDVFKRYIKPTATPKEVVRVAKISVFVWALFSAVLASIFYGAAKINMGWLFNFLGCATASAVFPIFLSFTWKDLNKVGAVGGSIGGMVLAIIVWLVTCKAYLGELSVDNLSNTWVSFAGNITALFSGAIISIVASLIKPANFNFDETRNRTSLVENLGGTVEVANSPEFKEAGFSKGELDVEVEEEKSSQEGTDTESKQDSDLDINLNATIDHKHLDHQFKKYIILVAILAFIMTLVIPVPLGNVNYVFSKGFLKAWVVIDIIWLFFSFGYVVLLPIFEARHTIWDIGKKVVGRA